MPARGAAGQRCKGPPKGMGRVPASQRVGFETLDAPAAQRGPPMRQGRWPLGGWTSAPKPSQRAGDDRLMRGGPRAALPSAAER